MPLVLALAAILLAGAALRVVGLGEDSLWNNEILSFQRASQATLEEAYALIREGTHPPLYAVGVLRPWFTLGDDEWMQRLPSALFGVLALWVTWRLGRRLFGTAAGLLAAGVLMALPLHVYYSREGRMYALLALVVTLWVAFLAKAVESNAWRHWAGYALAAAVSLYTHYYAGLSLLAASAFVAAWWVGWNRHGPTLVRWLLANAAVALLFAPWLPTLWYQLHNDPVSHLQPMAPIEVLGLPVQFFTVFERVGPMPFALIGAAVAWLLVAGAVATFRGPSPPSGRAFGHGLLLAVVLGTILVAELVSLLKPIMFVRYLVGILPAFALLLAQGVVAGRPRWVGAGALVLLLAVSAWTDRTILGESWRPDFRTPTALIRAQGAPGEVVLLFAPDGSSFNMAGFDHYYDAALPVVSDFGDDPVTSKLDAALARLGAPPPGLWVLQHRDVRRLTAPEGYRVTHRSRYRTRFFGRQERIGLHHLERLP